MNLNYCLPFVVVKPYEFAKIALDTLVFSKCLPMGFGWVPITISDA